MNYHFWYNADEFLTIFVEGEHWDQIPEAAMLLARDWNMKNPKISWTSGDHGVACAIAHDGGLEVYVVTGDNWE